MKEVQSIEHPISTVSTLEHKNTTMGEDRT